MGKALHVNLSDTDLFLLIKKGNEQAFTIAYHKYHKLLYVLAVRYLKDQELAADTVQFVFTKFWEFRSDLIITISLKNYLYTMTKNHILNQIRSENNILSRNYEIAQMTPEYEDNILETIENNELMSAFYQAIDLLPEQKRKICVLKLKEKISNQEIADQMSLSIHTVKTHYAQSLKLLRAYLEKMLLLLFLIILLFR